MIIDRYIARSVIKGTVGALLVFAALFIFIDFVRQMEHIGTNNFGLAQAVYFVLLNLPQRLYELTPSLILLGGLISLGGMASNSELIVLRASGITISRIVRSVLQAGLILAVMVAVAGEYLVPYTTNEAKIIMARAMDDRVLVRGQHGIWARDENRYINIQSVLPNMQLVGVSIYEIDDNRTLKRTTQAKGAYYEDDHWVLLDVVHSDISSEMIRVTSQEMEIWPDVVNTELFEVLEMDPEDMSASDLFKYSSYLQKNELDAVPYQLAFWIKIFTPLTCLVMLLIAMPLVFNTTPRSGGTGQRVITGILLGILFYVFNRAINHLGVVYGLMPVVSAAIPLIVVTIITTALIRRIR